jgi:hypothetical protein
MLKHIRTEPIRPNRLFCHSFTHGPIKSLPCQVLLDGILYRPPLFFFRALVIAAAAVYLPPRTEALRAS